MNLSDQVSYPALIGTATVPVALTTAYTANTSKVAIRFMPNVNISGTYTPGSGSTNSYMSLLIETSEDGSTWAPRPVISSTATAILDYAEAVPIQIPGDLTSTASTAISYGYQDTIAAKWMRVSVKETVGGGGAAGTVWLQVAASAN